MNWTRCILALALLLGSAFPASAEYTNTCSDSLCYFKDEGSARSACEASGQKIISKYTYVCERVTAAPMHYYCKGTGAGQGYSCSRLATDFFTAPKPAPVYSHFYFEDACTARQPMYAGELYDTTVKDGFVCANGCEYRLDYSIRKRLDTAGKDSILAGKGMQVPTGQSCKSPETPAKKPPDKRGVCSETLGGHTFCTRDDGKICVTSAGTGRTYCGPASDGFNATNPNRTENIKVGPPTPSPTPPTPPTPRPGEDWKPSGSGTINNISNNNSNSISMSGNAGTPNTTPGSELPGDGSENPGIPGGTDGEGEGPEPSTASGGACGSGWTTSGDAILGAILGEQHKQRCAGDKANKGFDDVAGTSLSDDGVLENFWKNPGSGPTLNRDLISIGGAGALFPSVQIEGQEWTVPESFYDAIAQIRFLIIAVCTIVAAFVVGRNI
ncbi:hypothetical protein [Lysobacter sp. ESA13C]|uniref:hypothetical protein n=1 Tax=Lysobacter sp. ESA13C TaxID=2862676 RepID=UPI001CBDAD9E|nr:hypothetical protein [Lysobacter sp. ESA13C]